MYYRLATTSSNTRCNHIKLQQWIGTDNQDMTTHTQMYKRQHTIKPQSERGGQLKHTCVHQMLLYMLAQMHTFMFSNTFSHIATQTLMQSVR